ncbi:MAG TPA: hypothetical protein VFP10_12910 [Candidatus Eisenbacteria bacterium]|nr:hypothetical protein [Candidatus Eisenbacteria bacterium]
MRRFWWVALWCAGAWCANTVPAFSETKAPLPNHLPAWSVLVDWDLSQLLALEEPPHPDSLHAPSITMLRNDYAKGGGFPLRELSIRAFFQVHEAAGRVAIGGVQVPSRFDAEGHVVALERPLVYQELRKPAQTRRRAQIVNEHAYYQDDSGRYFCRSFNTGEVDTLPFVGTVLGYSQDHLRALVKTSARQSHGLTISYYDLTQPASPKLIWSERFPNALPDPQFASIAPGGGLVAVQYVETRLELRVFDTAGKLRLRHLHDFDERPTLGVQFVSPTELLEGVESGKAFQQTSGLNLYRIK